MDWTRPLSCSRRWGVPRSLVIATLESPALYGRTGLRFSGTGIRVDVLNDWGYAVDVAIEIAADAELGPRTLIVERDGWDHQFPDVFTVTSYWPSYSGPDMRGIGSHLL